MSKGARLRRVPLAVAAMGLVFGFSQAGQAAQLGLAEIVNTTTTSIAPVVVDGLEDAFDGYSSILDLAGLSLSRQVNTLLSTNTYRTLDIFTNNTASTINTLVHYNSNLGSDYDEFVVEQGAFRAVSFEDDYAPFGVPDPHQPGFEGDPVLAFTFGNNAFTTANGAGAITPNYFDVSFNLSVAPGQSVGILQFATLVLDDTDRSGDVALALARSDALIAAPDLSGLSAQDIATIVNFDVGSLSEVPVPPALPLFLTGIAGLGVMRLRRRRVSA